MTGEANLAGNARHHVVVMGVSGCGKSTVGEALAEAIGAKYDLSDRFKAKPRECGLDRSQTAMSAK